jgi:hypothetical protein
MGVTIEIIIVVRCDKVGMIFMSRNSSSGCLLHKDKEGNFN